MSACVLLTLLALFADPSVVEIDTLRGDRYSGELVELGADVVRLRTAEATTEVPVGDVLEIRFTAPTLPGPSAGPRVALVDGTKLTLKDFLASGDSATLDSTCCGEIRVPADRVASVRFGISSSKLDEAWNALLARESKQDLLVTRKEDVLDFLPGVAGAVGEKIGFLLDGEEIPVPREKVYGLIYRRRATNRSKPVCAATLAGGDVLQATEVRIDQEGARATLIGGEQISIPSAAIAALDYSAGRVRYLSQIEPREVKYVPYFDHVWEYRRDRSFDGAPLSLAGKTYARGLAVHSKTTLRYRIAGEYSRFQTIVGIDDDVRRLGREVRLTISGDGKPLFDGPVSGKDPPKPLDLAVADVRDLEIVVDFGADGGADGDRLNLADAKLIK